jgi:hypothetical protein
VSKVEPQINHTPLKRHVERLQERCDILGEMLDQLDWRERRRPFGRYLQEQRVQLHRTIQRIRRVLPVS